MSKQIEKLIKRKIREIPDWPQKGINFKDITPLIENKVAFQKIINKLARPYLKGRKKLEGYKVRALAKY